MPEGRLNEDEARRWAEQMREAKAAGALDNEDAFERVEDKRAQWEDNVYERASQITSRRHEKETLALEKQVELVAPWVPDRSSILATQKVVDGSITGQTLPFHGLILLDGNLFRKAPESVTRAVAAHERTHLHVGGALRRAVFEGHQDLDRFFHDTVVPEWRHGEKNLPHPDRDFVNAKGWSRLYDEWLGPLQVTMERSKQALTRYFFLLEHDLIDYDPGQDRLERSVMNPDEDFVRENIIPKKERVPIPELYQRDPKKFLKILLTGYAVGEYLNDALKASIQDANGIDLLDVEEGFANVVGTESASISLDELQRYTRQDSAKIVWAERLQTIRGNQVPELLASVQNYEQLAVLAKSMR